MFHNVIFDTFDQERYSVFDNSSGARPLTNDTFEYGDGGSDIKIY